MMEMGPQNTEGSEVRGVVLCEKAGRSSENNQDKQMIEAQEGIMKQWPPGRPQRSDAVAGLM